MNNTLSIIFLVTITFFFLFLLLTLITLSIPKLYCFVWNHKEWKLWEEYIKRVDEFEFDNGLYKSYQFNLPGTEIQAHVWKKDENEDGPRLNAISGYCSIHNEWECLCCTYDHYHSKKMADLLMAKIKTENL